MHTNSYIKYFRFTLTYYYTTNAKQKFYMYLLIKVNGEEPSKKNKKSLERTKKT